MTHEEAARILDPKTTEEAYNDITYGYASKYWFSKWYNAKSEACKMGAEALRELDAKEKQKPMTEWISVKDRLPEPNVIVLCCTDKGYVDTDSFGRYSKVFLKCDDMEGTAGQVIAWMPLPEPPKDEHHAE